MTLCVWAPLSPCGRRRSAYAAVPPFSTGMHSFAQIFFVLLIDAANGCAYRARRSNASMMSFDGSIQTSRFLTGFAILANRGLPRFVVRSMRRMSLRRLPRHIESGESQKSRRSLKRATASRQLQRLLHRKLRGFSVWLGIREGFAAFAEPEPNREARRLYASVWRTRLAARLLGRRIDPEACRTYGSI